MSAKTRAFIKRKFLAYYSECFHQVGLPPSFPRREYAALLFRNKTMIRHRSFTQAEGLKEFLRTDTPSDVYYSSEKYENNTWPCEDCLNSAKKETVKLLDILKMDFGFSEKDLRVFFSGHRGYHVHVETEAIETLGTMDRKEIVDYVCGLGFDKELHGLKGDGSASFDLKAAGWQGRVARGIHDTVLSAELDDYRRIGLNKSIAQTIMRSKESILKNIKESKPWAASKGLGPQTLGKLVEHSGLSL